LEIRTGFLIEFHGGGIRVSEMRLKRGGRELSFIKVPHKFGVRLKHGAARSEDRLEAICGTLGVEAKYLEALPAAKMEVFVVDDYTKLDKAMEVLRSSSHVDTVSHIYKLEESPQSEVVPTGLMIIQFRSQVPAAEREKILAEFGLQVQKDLDFLPNGYAVKLSKEAKENPLKISAKLQQRKEIESAEPDITFRLDFLYTPSSPLYREQWPLKNRGDLLCTAAGADVKAEEAWDYTRGSRDIVICIMDNGFDLSLPELAAPGKIVDPMDLAENGFQSRAISDYGTHGTACAGVALAEDKGAGIVGLAPQCAFMPLGIPEVVSDCLVIAMFQYTLDHNADVISCCWKSQAKYFPLSTAVNAMIHKVATQGRKDQKGCVILFAAGNDDAPLNGAKGGTGWLGPKNGSQWLYGFAASSEVVAVGASNSRDKRAYYSNYGPELAVCAPSSGGASTRSLLTIGRRDGNGSDVDDCIFQLQGTSGATSLAAGLAGLILSLDPLLTSAEVKRIMMETADKIDAHDGKYSGGRSPLYGYGRINAYKALKYVAESKSLKNSLSS
jgi:subtilisin family serine protease